MTLPTRLLNLPVGISRPIPVSATRRYSQALSPGLVAQLQRTDLMPWESPRVEPTPAAPVRIYPPHTWSCAMHGVFRAESGRCPSGCSRMFTHALWDRSSEPSPRPDRCSRYPIWRGIAAAGALIAPNSGPRHRRAVFVPTRRRATS